MTKPIYVHLIFVDFRAWVHEKVLPELKGQPWALMNADFESCIAIHHTSETSSNDLPQVVFNSQWLWENIRALKQKLMGFEADLVAKVNYKSPAVEVSLALRSEDSYRALKQYLFEEFDPGVYRLVRSATYFGAGLICQSSKTAIYELNWEQEKECLAPLSLSTLSEALQVPERVVSRLRACGISTFKQLQGLDYYWLERHFPEWSELLYSLAQGSLNSYREQKFNNLSLTGNLPQGQALRKFLRQMTRRLERELERKKGWIEDLKCVLELPSGQMRKRRLELAPHTRRFKEMWPELDKIFTQWKGKRELPIRICLDARISSQNPLQMNLF